MEIYLTDCSLKEAMEELAFQQNIHPEVHFKGKGDGRVVIQVREGVKRR